MFGDDASFALQVVRSSVGNCLNTLEGGSLVAYWTSSGLAFAALIAGFLLLLSKISNVISANLPTIITASQYYDLISYCCSFSTIRILAISWYLVFAGLISLITACHVAVFFAALPKYITGNIWKFVKRSTGV